MAGSVAIKMHDVTKGCKRIPVGHDLRSPNWNWAALPQNALSRPFQGGGTAMELPSIFMPLKPSERSTRSPSRLDTVRGLIILQNCLDNQSDWF